MTFFIGNCKIKKWDEELDGGPPVVDGGPL